MPTKAGTLGCNWYKPVMRWFLFLLLTGWALAGAESIENKIQAGQYSQALIEIDEALKEAPDEPHLFFLKGAALVHPGRFPEAVEALEKKLARDGRSSSAWSLKGVALERMERPAEALQAFDEALRIEPNGTASLGRAAVHIRLGNVGVARQDYLAAADYFLKQSPDQARRALRLLEIVDEKTVASGQTSNGPFKPFASEENPSHPLPFSWNLIPWRISQADFRKLFHEALRSFSQSFEGSVYLLKSGYEAHFVFVDDSLQEAFRESVRKSSRKPWKRVKSIGH